MKSLLILIILLLSPFANAEFVLSELGPFATYLSNKAETKKHNQEVVSAVLAEAIDSIDIDIFSETASDREKALSSTLLSFVYLAEKEEELNKAVFGLPTYIESDTGYLVAPVLEIYFKDGRIDPKKSTYKLNYLGMFETLSTE